WLALAASAVAESLAPLLSALLKVLIDRPRPRDGRVHAVGPSFPSGHATSAGATSVVLVLLFNTLGTRRRLWWALAVLGVVGIAWSRTYLQVHWLTDVIAGALLGSGISLLVFAVAQLYRSWVLMTWSADAPVDASHRVRVEALAVEDHERRLDDLVNVRTRRLRPPCIRAGG